MKTSLSMWSVQKEFFANRINVKEFLKFAFENKVDAVELLDAFWKTESEIDEVLDMLNKNAWPVSCYSIGNDFVTNDAKELEEQIEYVKSGIDVAVKLNTQNLRIFSGNPKPEISYNDGLKSIIKGFRECISYAEEKGITMVLENHGLFAGKSAQVLNILNTIGSVNLKANIDTGNFLLVLENPIDSVKNLKDNIGFVHFKDFRRLDEDNGMEAYKALDGTLYQGTPIGKGDVPLEEIVKFLDNDGYNGYLSIEYEGVGDPIQETKDSVRYLQNIIK